MPRSLCESPETPRGGNSATAHALEQDLSARQRRRAEVLIRYAAGMEATSIAQALACHVNPIYADLRAFACHGVECVHQRLHGGAPARLTETQRADILHLADTPPGKVGLPYGRWSLAKLREYRLTHRVVKAISRKHLRRVLKKGGAAFAMANANGSAMTRGGGQYWRVSA